MLLPRLVFASGLLLPYAERVDDCRGPAEDAGSKRSGVLAYAGVNAGLSISGEGARLCAIGVGILRDPREGGNPARGSLRRWVATEVRVLSSSRRFAQR